MRGSRTVAAYDPAAEEAFRQEYRERAEQQRRIARRQRAEGDPDQISGPGAAVLNTLCVSATQMPSNCIERILFCLPPHPISSGDWERRLHSLHANHRYERCTFMDFVVRAVSTLPKVTGAVVESNNWRLHEGYPVVDWFSIANLNAAVVQERATGWDSETWVLYGDECGLIGPDLFAWSELHSHPLDTNAPATRSTGDTQTPSSSK